MANTYDLIYAVVRQIPYGQVATYGQVAELAGLIGKPRLVGYALYQVTDAEGTPWHRVINARGRFHDRPIATAPTIFSNPYSKLKALLLIQGEGLISTSIAGSLMLSC